MAKHFRGTKKQERALTAYVTLMRASETVHGEATRMLADCELSPSQFAVLEALHHVGPMVLSELARKILKTSGNLTMVVDNLQKRGLVRRIQSREDRRYTRVEATLAGHNLLHRIFPSHARKITGIMSRLSATEQDRLSTLCRKLGIPDIGKA
jgi:MarR family transcriptional regulator, 2-MHQ and catechol-resistance regulon repressor